MKDSPNPQNIQKHADEIILQVIKDLVSIREKTYNLSESERHFQVGISNRFIPLATETRHLISQNFESSTEKVTDLIKDSGQKGSFDQKIAAQQISDEMEKIKNTQKILEDHIEWSLGYLEHFLKYSHTRRYAVQTARNSIIIAIKQDRFINNPPPITEIDLDTFSSVASNVKITATSPRISRLLKNISLVDLRGDPSLEKTVIRENLTPSILNSYLSGLFLDLRNMFNLKREVVKDEGPSYSIGASHYGLYSRDAHGNMYYRNRSLSSDEQAKVMKEANERVKSEREEKMRIQNEPATTYIKEVRRFNGWTELADLGTRLEKDHLPKIQARKKNPKGRNF